MKAVLSVLVVGCVLSPSVSSARVKKGIAYLLNSPFGVSAKAGSYTPPSSSGASVHSVASTGSVAASFTGSARSSSRPPFVVSQLALNCLSVLGGHPSLGVKGTVAGLQCLSVPIPPALQPSGKKGKRAKPALPSPAVLAQLAVDRAIALAGKPGLQTAPSKVGLTGLDTYFWIGPPPRDIAAQAGVPGLTVTARAHPARYIWHFGDGATLETSTPGRPWTASQPGTIAHEYQTRSRYQVSVEIIWNADWRIGSGAWRGLGTFATRAARSFPVRQAVAVLVKS